MLIKHIILATSILSLAACTHTPSAGEKMLTHSDSARQLSEQWTHGEKTVADATKLKKNGSELIKKGHKNIEKGKKEIKEGSALIKEANKLSQKGLSLQNESEEQFNENFAPKEL